MCQQFTCLAADEHTQIVSVVRIKKTCRSILAQIFAKNDGFVHKSVTAYAAIEFHPVVPSPDEESTFHAEDVEDTEVEYNSFHSFFFFDQI